MPYPSPGKHRRATSLRRDARQPVEPSSDQGRLRRPCTTYAGYVDEPEDQQVRHAALARTDQTLLHNVREGAKTEWVFAIRDWVAT